MTNETSSLVAALRVGRGTADVRRRDVQSVYRGCITAGTGEATSCIGAAIGTFSGRKVVQYAHGHPGNRLDRVILRTSIVPDGHGGVALAFSFPR